MSDARVLTPARASSVSVVASIGLGIAALVLMGHDSWRQGGLLLPGDPDPAPMFFRTVHSLVSLAYPGLIEEGATRNIVQFGLQRAMNPLLAEALAGGLFVVLHAFRWTTPAELPFITLVALVCGRLAAVTQSARYPALAHSLANIGIGATILLLRK